MGGLACRRQDWMIRHAASGRRFRQRTARHQWKDGPIMPPLLAARREFQWMSLRKTVPCGQYR
jgi:hypothetical protein